jgi:hypothetical protein
MSNIVRPYVLNQTDPAIGIFNEFSQKYFFPVTSDPTKYTLTRGTGALRLQCLSTFTGTVYYPTGVWFKPHVFPDVNGEIEIEVRVTSLYPGIYAGILQYNGIGMYLNEPGDNVLANAVIGAYNDRSYPSLMSYDGMLSNGGSNGTFRTSSSTLLPNPYASYSSIYIQMRWSIATQYVRVYVSLGGTSYSAAGGASSNIYDRALKWNPAFNGFRVFIGSFGTAGITGYDATISMLNIKKGLLHRINY